MRESYRIGRCDTFAKHFISLNLRFLISEKSLDKITEISKASSPSTDERRLSWKPPAIHNRQESTRLTTCEGGLDVCLRKAR